MSRSPVYLLKPYFLNDLISILIEWKVDELAKKVMLMTKKKKKPDDSQTWIEARKRYHLSHTHIQMARELGMNPEKFGKFDNYKQEPWKPPLPAFIEEIYFQRFKKKLPDNARSIEQVIKDQIISELIE